MANAAAETIPNPQPESISDGHSAGYRRYVLSILMLVYVMNFIDRQIINILAEPIKLELDLADWQLGMMTGLAFALFYSVLGLPIARLAERANRVYIITASLVIWSGFTAACGLANNFLQLLLFRIGVGVGEAGCSPSSHSLISDYVPIEKRASALAFYSLGIPLGSMAGMAIGGLIADAYGWRAAMLIVGAPGIILALLAVLTVKETRTTTSFKPIKTDAPSFRDTMREIASKKSFWWAAVGASFTSFVTYGHTAFYGSFFFRNHADGVADLAARASAFFGVDIGPVGFVGTSVGLVIGLAGVTGTFLGGVLSDHFGKRDARAFVLIPAAAAFLGVPFAFLALFVEDMLAAMLILTIPILLKSLWYGPIFATAQSLVRPRSRATAAAVVLFLLNLIGLGLGPLTIGALSDLLASNLGEAEGLRWAMAIGSGTGFISVACFLMAARTVRSEIVS